MSWAIKDKLQQQLSREDGGVVKDRGGKTSIALVYPNTYAVGMGNLAVHALYKMLNDRADIVCERAFLPEKKALAEHRRTNTPILTMESQRPISEFDVVAFSISFENDYLNILSILELSKIPHLAEKREKNLPLLIAGGAAISLNPRPVSRIFDAVVLGEAECFADDFIPLLAAGNPKAETIELMSKITPPPDLLPQGEEGLQHKRRLENLDAWPTETQIHSRDAEFGDMHLIEVQRGCPYNCHFCATPSLYAPPRMRSAKAVLSMVDGGLKYRNRFGLIGAYIMMHPEFEAIAEEIHARGATFSPSSVHARGIDDARAKLLAASNLKSVALGIETGNDSLRNTIGKQISNEEYIEAAAILARNGITNLRLYFMIGLPGETEDDIESIAGLSLRIHGIVTSRAPRAARSAGISLTLSPFVPKPGTPLKNAEFAGAEVLKKKLRAIEKMLKKEKGIELNSDSVQDSAVEAILSRGSEEALRFIEECHRTGSPKEAMKKMENEQL